MSTGEKWDSLHVWGSVAVEEGISATSTAGKVMNLRRQEGSSVQHDSVASVGANPGSLTLSSLFLAYLSTTQLSIKFLYDK